jgi:long-chain acyl-CoA synthetase
METETNLAAIFRNRAATYGDAPRWRQRRHGVWRSATWRENQAIVNSVLAGLDALGARPGDVIGIVSNPRWEWMAADWAIMGLGASTTALYPTQVPSNFAFILNDCGARYLFVEDRKQYDKLVSIRDAIPQVRKLILFEDAEQAATDPWALSFDQLCQLSRLTPAEADALAAERAAAIHPGDVASIIYTSGTTGQPKGVIHTHATLMAQIASATAVLSTIRPGMVDVLFLPLAHVFARIEHLAGYERGIVTVVAPSLLGLVQDIQEVKPDLLFSVPRVYERAYATIQRRAMAGSPMRRDIFQWASRVGREVCRLRQRHQPIPPVLGAQYRIADWLVFRKVRQALGGRLAFAVTSAAPLAPEILEFFHGAGVLLLEAWGLTETGGGFTVNAVDHYRIGTVGRVIPGHEIRIADDGEILIRGPCICRGYLNNPQATADAIDAEGWFHTGDIGTLDAEGYLRIMDRKKDLIVMAGGEKVAPQLVENLLRAIPCVSQACVYGEGRSYVVALITLDAEAVRAWASEHDIANTDVRDVCTSAAFRAYLDEQVSEVNARLGTYEAVRNYEILPEDFSVADGLLTPTLKIRREQIYERYREHFRGLYRRAEAELSASRQ